MKRMVDDKEFEEVKSDVEELNDEVKERYITINGKKYILCKFSCDIECDENVECMIIDAYTYIPINHIDEELNFDVRNELKQWILENVLAIFSITQVNYNAPKTDIIQSKIQITSGTGDISCQNNITSATFDWENSSYIEINITDLTTGHSLVYSE